MYRSDIIIIFLFKKRKKGHLVWEGRKKQRKLKRVGHCLEKSRKKTFSETVAKTKKIKH